MKRYRRLSSLLFKLLSVIAAVAVWQGVFSLGANVFSWWKPYAFPSPVGVFESFISLIESGTFWVSLYSSMRRAVIGFALSLALGGAISLLMLRFSHFRDMIRPLLLGIQTLPSICWVPFAILWFGLSEASIIFVIIMGSAFSIATAFDTAVRGINPVYKKAARTMGVSRIQLYFKVVIPASLPSLIGGMKQGWSFSWRALMSGEVMSAAVGLGQALILGRDLADINRVTLIMILIVVIGVVIDRLIFTVIENRILTRHGLKTN